MVAGGKRPWVIGHRPWLWATGHGLWAMGHVRMMRQFGLCKNDAIWSMCMQKMSSYYVVFILLLSGLFEVYDVIYILFI